MKSFLIGMGILFLASSAHAACPAAPYTMLNPGDVLATKVNPKPSMTKFCFAPGTYRRQTMDPPSQSKFYAQDATSPPVLNGSKVLTFTADGALWVSINISVQGDESPNVFCLTGHAQCAKPEIVFVNNVALESVASKVLVTAGKFYYDYALHKIWIANNPTGKTVELTAEPYAFGGNATNVYIEGVIVEKYASPVQTGAIGNKGFGANWYLKDVEARYNYGAGVSLTDGTIVNSYIHHNGQLGIGCGGDGVIIQNNEISYNSYFSFVDPVWEGGGGKCANTTDLVFKNNFTHHNNGYGFWTDINNYNSSYENNQVENNVYGGISHEISYLAKIFNNTFVANGAGDPRGFFFGAAVLIQDSQDVEVYGNTVDMRGGKNGITMIQQGRGTGDRGPYYARNNYIHNNTIINTALVQGKMGTVVDDSETPEEMVGNVIDYNTYKVQTKTLQDSWCWLEECHVWLAYKSYSGQDAHSTVTVVPINSGLLANGGPAIP
jgi:hypothetical protein